MTSFTTIAVLVVGGVFILGLGAFWIWLMFKYLKLGKLFKNLILKSQRKKLLKDEKLLEYCAKRAQRNWTESQVRSELLLAKGEDGKLKYKIGRIDQVAYVYNIVKKEIEGGEQSGTSQRERGTESKTSQAYPD